MRLGILVYPSACSQDATQAQKKRNGNGTLFWKFDTRPSKSHVFVKFGPFDTQKVAQNSPRDCLFPTQQTQQQQRTHTHTHTHPHTHTHTHTQTNKQTINNQQSTINNQQSTTTKTNTTNTLRSSIFLPPTTIFKSEICTFLRRVAHELATWG